MESHSVRKLIKCEFMKSLTKMKSCVTFVINNHDSCYKHNKTVVSRLQNNGVIITLFFFFMLTASVF